MLTSPESSWEKRGKKEACCVGCIVIFSTVQVGAHVKVRLHMRKSEKEFLTNVVSFELVQQSAFQLLVGKQSAVGNKWIIMNWGFSLYSGTKCSPKADRLLLTAYSTVHGSKQKVYHFLLVCPQERGTVHDMGPPCYGMFCANKKSRTRRKELARTHLTIHTLTRCLHCSSLLKAWAAQVWCYVYQCDKADSSHELFLLT